jgi:hypothetical protein
MHLQPCPLQHRGEKKNQKTKKPVTNLQTIFFVFCFAFLSTASGDYAN